MLQLISWKSRLAKARFWNVKLVEVPLAIYWTKDGKRLLQSAYPSPLSVDAQDSTLGLGFTRSRLFVNCASHEDAGIYSCVAENEYIRAFKDSQVFVDETLDANNEIICLDKKPFVGIPARVHMWTHTRLEVMGKDAQLYCRSSGDPKPRVMWKGPDEEVITSSKKYKFLPNGDMIVRNIDWTDMGVYTCVATNSEGSDEAMVFLYPTMPENNIEM
ncbi:zwei Ig domain protein zig-3 [Caerostris extrusa]|uniref:Zwei Ig domain protein zig-3 n=1 Tax=Caerostris extrusa TaxID=172846 RepID=A0AAV4UDS0_CAEEX|nr:zwei Ig domain protein zig-3 [Caerostris extrusa]